MEQEAMAIPPFPGKRPVPQANKERNAMTDQAELRQAIERIQRYIDENHIYRVEFGHYDTLGQWTPLKTRRINLLEEVFSENDQQIIT